MIIKNNPQYKKALRELSYLLMNSDAANEIKKTLESLTDNTKFKSALKYLQKRDKRILTLTSALEKYEAIHTEHNVIRTTRKTQSNS